MLTSSLAAEAIVAFELKNETGIILDNDTGCIILDGAKPRTTFTYQGYQLPVYRWVMIALGGYLEPEQMILHNCDNACCFNPEHLRVGSHAENNKDRRYRR